MAERLETGAGNRRLTADRVRVLHPLAMEVGGADLAVPHQLAQRGGDIGLAGVPADLLNAFVERTVAALDRVGGHGAGHKRRGQDVLRAERRGQRQRGGHLGAVEQGKAFLRRQTDRFGARFGQRLDRWYQPASEVGLALAEQHAREMGERGEVAGGADGALRRNAGVDLVLEQRRQRFDEFQPDTGMTAGRAPMTLSRITRRTTSSPRSLPTPAA